MFQGSMVAIVTPMHANGSIDYHSLEKLLAWHLEQGTESIVVLGTTGESVTIEFAERREIIQCTLACVKGKVPVIVGTGSNATQHAIEFTKQAMELGADATLLVTPYYNKPTQEGLFQHYRAVAKAVAIPQILYNVPGRTACDLLPQTVARLSAFSNIVGIKEATGNVDRLKALKALNIPMDFYSGDDFTALPFMLSGGHGVISVVANVAPALMFQMCRAALTGDVKTATKIDEQLQPLARALFLESNPIPTKWLLQKMGFIQSGIRLPLTTLSAAHHAKMLSAFDHVQLPVS